MKPEAAAEDGRDVGYLRSHILISVGLFVISAMWFLFHIASPDPLIRKSSLVVIPFYLLLISLLWYSVTKVRIWLKQRKCRQMEER